ncbi:MAG: ABC transporter ATP-binding protein [Candidatus Aureabacteria bacterium]|nr:ABC transporter ATP-binding protein [Candidatus Auribacterota bacterium]
MSDHPHPQALLEVRGVHKSYGIGGAALHVLKGVDLTVVTGEILAIVGPSGAGKSTLLHIMGALDHPDSGSVSLEGQDLFLLSENARSKVRNLGIGFVFQFYHLLPEFTALENVMMPALVYGEGVALHRGECVAKAAELLDAVGLKDRVEHKPAELSGGEQQRVAIARALMNGPRLILADEPSGNLDTRTSMELHQLIAELNQNSGRTFVIVTHDPDLAQIAHRRLGMRDGRIETSAAS